MPENIQWIDLFNNIGGKNSKDTILRTPVTDALDQKNIDLVTGGFKKANGITRYVEAPLLSSGTYYDGVAAPAASSPAWTGTGASTGTFASSGGIGTITEDDSGAINSRFYITEAGFTTGTDAAYEIRCSIDDGGTLSGVYAFSICVLDDSTNRFELVAIESSGTKYVAVLTTTSDRTVVGSYSSLVEYDWTAMTRYRVSFDASGNVLVYINDLVTEVITIAVSSLPASTETTLVGFGSYESATSIVFNIDYIVYTVGATSLTTATITGLFDFLDETGTHHYLMTALTGLYKFNSTTNKWDSITLGTAFTSGALTHFSIGRETSGGTAICIITTESRDTPQKYDGSTAADLGGTPPSGKYCIIFNDRTFIGNTSSAPTASFFSALGDSEDRDDGSGTWDTTNDVILADRFVFGELTGYAILGGAQDQGNMLLIFFERGIKRLTGWGKGSYLLETVSANHGCVASRSIQVGPLGPENNEGVYFRDTDGYFWTNGQIGNVIRISNKIGPTIQSSFNNSLANKDVGFISNDRQLVGWSYANGASVTNDDTIAFDYFHGSIPGEFGRILESWGHYDYQMSAAARFYESSGKDIIVYGTTTGLIYKQDSGTDWDGGDYTASRETAWINCGIPHYVKAFRYLTIFCQTVGNFYLTVEWALNWSDSYTNSTTISMAGSATFVLGTGVLGVTPLGSGGAIRKRSSLDAVGNSIRFKFSTSQKDENFVIYGFSLGYQQYDWMDSNA